jgi:hypothetical protein
MKTLRESLLADMDDVFKAGDKYQKLYNNSIAELNEIYTKICNIKDWYWGGNGKLWGQVIHGGIMVSIPNLAKYYNLSAKNMYLNIIFDDMIGEWIMHIILAGSSKTTINKYSIEITNRQKEFLVYRFADTSWKSMHNKSKYTKEDFINKYLLPIFNDINSFEEHVVNAFKNYPGTGKYGKVMPKQTI